MEPKPDFFEQQSQDIREISLLRARIVDLAQRIAIEAKGSHPTQIRMDVRNLLLLADELVKEFQ